MLHRICNLRKYPSLNQRGIRINSLAYAKSEALSDSCAKLKQPFILMVSRAYHDSLFVSRIAPVAMLFIPCRNGYSHRPDEFAAPEDIARGVTILAETLAGLAE